MSKISNKRIDLRKIIARPVLEGTVDNKNRNYMWTGIPSARRLKDDNILNLGDERSREFLDTVRRYEVVIEQIRNCNMPQNNLIVSKKENNFEMLKTLKSQLDELIKRIRYYLKNNDNQLDFNLFAMALQKDYEEIKENNPSELEKLPKDARDALESNREIFEENNNPISRMMYSEEYGYYCDMYTTKSQANYIKKHSTQDVLVKAIRQIKGCSTDDVLLFNDGKKVIEELACSIPVLDLQEMLINKAFKNIQYIVYFNNYLMSIGMKPEEIDKKSSEELSEMVIKNYADTLTSEEHSVIFTQHILNNLYYMDFEKFLLIAMARPLMAFETMHTSEELAEKENVSNDNIQEDNVQVEDNSQQPLTKDIDGYIYSGLTLDELVVKTKRAEYIVNSILSTGTIKNSTIVNIRKGDDSGEFQEVSLRYIKNLMKNYCNGVYLTESLKPVLKKDIFLNDGLKKCPDELISKLEFSEYELYILSVIDTYNMGRLYKSGKLTKDDAREILILYKSGELSEDINKILPKFDDNKKDDINNNLDMILNIMVDCQIVELKDLKEYYQSGIIDISMLEKLEKGKNDKEISELRDYLKAVFNEEMLLEGYKCYTEKYIEYMNFQRQFPDDLEGIENLKKQLEELRVKKENSRQVFLKYNEINLNNKVFIGEKILETYYIDMGIDTDPLLEETIKNLYEDGMITLENIVGVDNKYIIPMLDKLTLEDAAKVRNSMSSNDFEKMCNTIFDDVTISNERKFIMVMNLFTEDTPEDKEAREYYLSFLEFNDNEKKSKKQGTRVPKNVGSSSKESNKYVYPDFIKWKFYRALDPDVRATRYANGFVEFASAKLGVRILEKYYDGDKPAYGTATYILSEEEYRKNQGELISMYTNGNVLESAVLREITPRANRIAHRTQSIDKTWMDSMVKYFDIDYTKTNDTRYTTQELEELQNVVVKHKTDYELID